MTGSSVTETLEGFKSSLAKLKQLESEHVMLKGQIDEGMMKFLKAQGLPDQTTLPEIILHFHNKAQ